MVVGCVNRCGEKRICHVENDGKSEDGEGYLKTEYTSNIRKGSFVSASLHSLGVVYLQLCSLHYSSHLPFPTHYKKVSVYIHHKNILLLLLFY